MSERDRGVYAPPVHDKPGFGPISATAEEGGGRGPLLLGVTLAVLFAVIGVIWSSYHQGVREGGRDAPPRILASNDPIKVRPADPGGEQVDNQDMTIFDVLEEPPARDPGMSEREYMASLLNDDINGASADLRGDWQMGEPADAEGPPVGEPVQVSAADRLPPEPRLKPLQRVRGVVITGDGEEAPGRPRTLADASDAVARSGSASVAGPAAGGVTQARPATPTTSPPVTTGAFLVQIASFRTPEAADTGWASFEADFSDMLNGRRQDVARADLGDRGVHFRLRIGDFGDRQAASVFCDRLKARGQECLVARH